MSSLENIFTCRLCAEVYPKNLVIENTNVKYINLNPFEKIYQFFNLDISNNNILPKDICCNCFKKVFETNEFHKQIQKAQEILQDKFEVKLEECDIKSEDENNFHSLDTNQWDSTEDIPLINRVVPKIETRDDIIKSEDAIKDNKNTTSKTVKNESKKSRKIGDVSKEEFKRHLKEIIEEWKNYTWICNVCKVDFKGVKLLRDHYGTEHGDVPVEYTCMECSKVYTKYDLFKKHMRVHRNKFKYKCDICGKFSYSKSVIDQHLRIKHSTDRKFMCSTCGKSFKTQQTLLTHGQKHLPDELKSFLECDVCHKKFTNSSNLNTHKKIHSGIKQHTCEQCGKSFIQKNAMIRHIEDRHTEGQRCQCPLCPKVFKNKYNLNQHKECHLEGQPHKCEVCSRTFRRKRALILHSRIHTNELPHECEYCKKCFREKSYLKIHLRQHTGERPYSCIECNHHFSNDSNFIKHLKGRHGLRNFSLSNQRQYPFVNLDNNINKESQNVSNQFSSVI